MGKLFLSLLLFSLSVSNIAFADPTRPLFKQAKPSPTVKKTAEKKQPLTAIFTKGKDRYAVIEEKIYRVGDSYRNAQVIRITDDRVILRTAQGIRRLTLIQKIKK